MGRYPKQTLEPHLTSAELQQRFRATKDAAEARRWQALWLFSQGQAIGSVAEVVALHRNTVYQLIKRYNQHGPEAVGDRRADNPGSRKPILSAEQDEQLRQALQEPHPEGGLWTSARVARWIAQATGRSTVYVQFGWFTLRRLGFTPQVPRPRHRDAATPEEQEEWKKN